MRARSAVLWSLRAIAGPRQDSPSCWATCWGPWPPKGEQKPSAWLHKLTIVYRPTIRGPLPHGRGSEGSANKPLPGRMDDGYTPLGKGFLNTRTFAIKH